jgi:twitching motility protein PilT
MLGTSAIRNLIREAKVAQMYSTIQTSNSVGMQTLDQNLTDLVRRNIISPAEARSKAKIPENFPADGHPRQPTRTHLAAQTAADRSNL